MKVPFPKATVYQKYDAAVAPVEIRTHDGPSIFLAFEDWKTAVLFCRRNRNAASSSRRSGWIVVASSSRTFSPPLHFLRPRREFLPFQSRNAVGRRGHGGHRQADMAAQGNQLEAKRCQLEWPSDAYVDLGSMAMEVGFFDYVGRNRRRIGKLAFFALPLDDRNDFSCIPEHLITFDEAKWIAGEFGRAQQRPDATLWEVRAGQGMPSAELLSSFVSPRRVRRRGNFFFTPLPIAMLEDEPFVALRRHRYNG